MRFWKDLSLKVFVAASKETFEPKLLMTHVTSSSNLLRKLISLSCQKCFMREIFLKMWFQVNWIIFGLLTVCLPRVGRA
jgi:hypothetical protein